MTTATRPDAAPNTEVANRLGCDVAGAIDLYTQIKQAHWTVVGPNFIALHELFDRQAALMRGHVDTLAERLRALGGIPQGTARQAGAASELPDLPAEELPERDAVTAILERYDVLRASCAESAEIASEADDVATEDVYIEVMRDLDLQRWFLRSHLG
ncbi:MAG: DNA starvation/stationary phase protection protein Dps [Dehalococcoidia bacterium]